MCAYMKSSGFRNQYSQEQIVQVMTRNNVQRICKKRMGWRNGSVDEVSCWQGWGPEFNPRETHMVEVENKVGDCCMTLTCM